MTTTQPAQRRSSFEDFDLGDDILRAISEAGFRDPRPIQTAAIPDALEGRDVLGLAQTGTGKTAAFALPIIEYLAEARGQHTRALILAPTRELAIQIQEETQLLAKYTDVRSVTVFGGVPAGPQIRALRGRPDIIVACPGRLLDLLSSRDARLDHIEVLVLDEADHMLDMGFLPDIKRILARLPERRQNLLFSATMPTEIRSLADHVLYEPLVVELAHSMPAATIEHALYPIDKSRKVALLRHLMDADEFKSAIVFLRTKHRAKRLARDLERDGYRAVALQGNMSQGQRQRAMRGFRDGSYNVLVATDIAARGIDVAQVSHVINFDVPNTPDAYTHRIGRTGRAECKGKAYTFVTHEDSADVKAIERRLDMDIPRVKLREFQTPSRGRDQADGQRRGQSGGRRGASQRRRSDERGSPQTSSTQAPSTRKAPSRNRRRRRKNSQGTSGQASQGSSSRARNGPAGNPPPPPPIGGPAGAAAGIGPPYPMGRRPPGCAAPGT